MTDSKNPNDYLKAMRKRDNELNTHWQQLVSIIEIGTAARIELEQEAQEKVITSENYLNYSTDLITED